MDDDSLNFGSPAAAATPNSNSILAQPPLQSEDVNGSGQEDRAGEIATGDGKFPVLSILSL
jgi:SWI/SNF related-matrix-associated actin-dependent regulator of chromatin subfamily C